MSTAMRCFPDDKRKKTAFCLLSSEEEGGVPLPPDDRRKKTAFCSLSSEEEGGVPLPPDDKRKTTAFYSLSSEEEGGVPLTPDDKEKTARQSHCYLELAHETTEFVLRTTMRIFTTPTKDKEKTTKQRHSNLKMNIQQLLLNMNICNRNKT
jgi:hypothetical protein